MNEEIIEKTEAELAAENDEKESTEEHQETSNVKKELERVSKKEPRTEAEKAAFSLKKNAERAKELGLDPKAILGIETEENAEDDAPVTVGMLKKLDKERANQTALSLAEDIEDADDRELTKYHLANTIKPSGDAKEDLRNATAIVNSVKNGMIVEELGRKGEAATRSGGGAPPLKTDESVFEPTLDEANLMRPPFNLSKEDILKARKQTEQAQK